MDYKNEELDKYLKTLEDKISCPGCNKKSLHFIYGKYGKIWAIDVGVECNVCKFKY